MLSFTNTVSAITCSVIREQCSFTEAARSCSPSHVTRFVIEQHGRMPQYLRLPLKVLTLILDAWTLPVTGRPFHSLPHERRWRVIESWKHSPMSFRRDLIKFYESLAIFGCYSDAYDRTSSEHHHHAP